MAKASEQTTSTLQKILMIGNSGAGKTGSLVSMIKAGYDVRILDMDDGTAALRAFVMQECPERIDQLDYISLRDNFKPDPIKGAKVAGTPKAYTNAIKYLNEWDDGTKPAEWGDKTIFVLDSLTLFGRAAFRWAQGMDPSCRDPRQWYSTAQESVQTVIDMLTSTDFGCHVIVMSHIDYIESSDGTTKGFASAIGKALGPKLPAVFNTMLTVQAKGSGDKIKRKIGTVPTAMIEAKNPKPFKIEKEYGIEDGLAKIFAELVKP